MINNRTLYAIRALYELAESEGFHSTAESIAQAQDISKKFLPQILNDLSRIGVVRSTRGFGGGVRLSRPPEKISILEIFEAFQSNIFVDDDLVGQGGRQRAADAKLMRVFRKIQDDMRKELARVSIRDLTSRQKAKRKRVR